MKTVRTGAATFALPACGGEADAHGTPPAEGFAVHPDDEAVESLPKTSGPPIAGHRLLGNGDTGVRVLRVSDAVARHHRAFPDAWLHILSGEAEFAAGAGDMVFRRAMTEHETIRVSGDPLVMLAIDVPTRGPADGVFGDGDEDRPLIEPS